MKVNLKFNPVVGFNMQLIEYRIGVFSFDLKIKLYFMKYVYNNYVPILLWNSIQTILRSVVLPPGNHFSITCQPTLFWIWCTDKRM